MSYTKVMEQALAERRELKRRAREARDAGIRARFLEGVELPAIAERYGVTVDTVEFVLLKRVRR